MHRNKLKLVRFCEMNERTMFAVIADKLSTDVTQFRLNSKLTELGEDDIQAMVENLADNNSAWKDVLKGARIAVIFDVESGDKISINRGSIKFMLDM